MAGTHAHAGLGIADFYLEESDADPSGFAFVRDPTHWGPTLVGTAASMLLLALNALEIARRKPHRSTQLKNAGKRLGVRMVIARSDGTTMGACA